MLFLHGRGIAQQFYAQQLGEECSAQLRFCRGKLSGWLHNLRWLQRCLKVGCNDKSGQSGKKPPRYSKEQEPCEPKISFK